MAFEFSTQNNYVFITDNVSGQVGEGIRKDVRISKNDSGEYDVIGLFNPLPKNSFPYSEIKDSEGSDFASEAAFVDWYTKNTGEGFSSALGGSSAGALLDSFGWVRDGLMQFSQVNVQQLYTKGLTFRKFNADGTVTEVTIPETDGVTLEQINPYNGAVLTGIDAVTGFDYDSNNINNLGYFSDANTSELAAAGHEVLHALFYNFTQSKFQIVNPVGSNSTPQNVYGYEPRTILGGYDNIADDIVLIATIVVSQSTSNYYSNNASGVFNRDKVALTNS